MARISDKTLGEYALNPDGKTYSGAKAVQWLFEAMTGRGMSDEDAHALIKEAREKAARDRAEKTPPVGHFNTATK